MINNSKITILFVDDESDILSSINRFLRKESYNKLFAENGIKALELIAAYPVSIIVSDLRMPEMNGLDLISKVKQLNPDIVRLILSGSQDINSIIESINKGEVFRFVPKPVDPTSFKKILNDTVDYYCLKAEREKLVEELSIKNQELTKANETLSIMAKKLQRSEEEFRSMTDALHDAVFMLNNDGKIMYRNIMAENLFGFSRDTYLGQNFMELISPDSPKFDIDALCEMPSGKIPDFEGQSVHQIEGLKKNGTSVPLEITSGCVPIGDIPRTVIVARNITARVEAEKSRLHFENMQKEFESEIEKKLLQSTVPDSIQGVTISRMMVTSGHLDGDFTDFIILDHHHIDILIGDVMGHGLQPALIGAGIKSLFLKVLAQIKYLHRALPALSDIVAGVHELCIKELIALGTFATLLYVRIDLESGQLSIVDCGHPPIIHFHADTENCTFLKGENLPIGMIKKQNYESLSFSVKKDDIIVLYSDGITESSLPDGSLFGIERLHDLILENHHMHPDILVEKIRATVFSTSDKGMLDDDATCIVIRIGDKTEIIT